VLELRAADLATGEIARVLGISEQNVRTAQARAVARLRRLEGVGLAAAGRAADA
jgi:DNA-directed RNA polymerase specialized sigma24 family protein